MLRTGDGVTPGPLEKTKPSERGKPRAIVMWEEEKMHV